LADGIEALEAGLAESLGQRDAVRGRLLMELARATEEAGHYEDAVGYASRARDLFEAIEDLRGLAQATRVLGGAYNSAGRIGDANDALREALALAERTGDVEAIGACLVNLGFVQQRLGLVEDGIRCDRRAITEFERIGHPV